MTGIHTVRAIYATNGLTQLLFIRRDKIENPRLYISIIINPVRYFWGIQPSINAK
jgi:hypothetical protein